MGLSCLVGSFTEDTVRFQTRHANQLTSLLVCVLTLDRSRQNTPRRRFTTTRSTTRILTARFARCVTSASHTRLKSTFRMDDGDRVFTEDPVREHTPTRRTSRSSKYNNKYTTKSHCGRNPGKDTLRGISDNLYIEGSGPTNSSSGQRRKTWVKEDYLKCAINPFGRTRCESSNPLVTH